MVFIEDNKKTLDNSKENPLLMIFSQMQELYTYYHFDFNPQKKLN